MEALSSSQGSKHHDRLFSLAMSKFDFAIRATPDNNHMIIEYGDMLSRFALLKTNANEEAVSYFEKSMLKYTVARYVKGLNDLSMSRILVLRMLFDSVCELTLFIFFICNISYKIGSRQNMQKASLRVHLF
jgi:hypothetical protein